MPPARLCGFGFSFPGKRREEETNNAWMSAHVGFKLALGYHRVLKLLSSQHPATSTQDHNAINNNKITSSSSSSSSSSSGQANPRKSYQRVIFSSSSDWLTTTHINSLAGALIEMNEWMNATTVINIKCTLRMSWYTAKWCPDNGFISYRSHLQISLI